MHRDKVEKFALSQAGGGAQDELAQGVSAVGDYVPHCSPREAWGLSLSRGAINSSGSLG